MPRCRRNSERDKVKDASGQAWKLRPRIWFYHPRGVGVAKACLFLSGNSSSSLVSRKRYIQISWKVVFKLLPSVWILTQAHPSPTQCPEAILTPPLVKQACLVWISFFFLFLFLYFFSTVQHGGHVTHTCIHNFSSHSSDNTKPQSSKRCGTGTKTDI